MVVLTGPEATVRTLTREDMLRERAELLIDAGMTEKNLRRLAASYELDAHHRGLLARIDGLDFLLKHAAE
jgi:hypothetical protein